MANSFRHYLWIDGVKGDSKDRAHPGWIPILSFQWGVDPASMGNGQGEEVENQGIRDLVFESPADRSGPVLMIASATGGQLGSARLDRVLPDGGSRTLVTLKDADGGLSLVVQLPRHVRVLVLANDGSLRK